uniref:Reverse transcriptase Ty1/copia-type domain-containing protein n=1 Tax=Peronospora matthiolae TaxID=2874970 RepID=A0AAV1VFP5_9STRA
MDMTTMKIILALAATWGVPAKHEDVPNTYVKEEKEQHLDILMHFPKGMTIDTRELQELGATKIEDVVFELKKSLYGLKQAGRLWSQLLNNRLLEAGFTRCISDFCLYYKRDIDGVVIVGVYVDDLLVTGTPAVAVYVFFASLESLSTKDIGPVSRYLGMRVTRNEDRGYFLDQEEAIVDLLRDHGMTDVNSSRAPIGTDVYEVHCAD